MIRSTVQLVLACLLERRHRRLDPLLRQDAAGDDRPTRRRPHPGGIELWKFMAAKAGGAQR